MKYKISQAINLLLYYAAGICVGIAIGSLAFGNGIFVSSFCLLSMLFVFVRIFFAPKIYSQKEVDKIKSDYELINQIGKF